MTTHTLNFTPDDREKELIDKASKGSWDAGIDLAMLNILYSDRLQGWHKISDGEDLRNEADATRFLRLSCSKTKKG